MAKANRSELVAAIDPSNISVLGQTARKVLGSGSSAAALVSRQIDSQAVMLATNDFYVTATLLMLATIAVVWLIKRPKGPLKTVAH